MKTFVFKRLPYNHHSSKAAFFNAPNKAKGEAANVVAKKLGHNSG